MSLTLASLPTKTIRVNKHLGFTWECSPCVTLFQTGELHWSCLCQITIDTLPDPTQITGVCVYVYVCMCVCVCVRVRVCACVCACVCMVYCRTGNQAFCRC